MLTVSTVAAGIMAGSSFRIYSRLQSWLGDTCLSEEIPAFQIVEESDDTLRVPERLTFRVPTVVGAVSWVPTAFDSPLGVYGQRIVAQVGIGVSNSQIEWLTRGRFLMHSAETDDKDVITCEALGLLTLLDEAQLATEYQPKAGATFGTIIRALVEPGITVDLTAAPTDRAAPNSISWSDNRLDDVQAVLDAWPAQGEISDAGTLKITPVPADPTVGDAVFHFHDALGGTADRYNTSISRDVAYNGVVAKGQYPDSAGAKSGQEIISVVQDTDPASPYRVGGPFSPYLKPFGYASPLLTTVSQVKSAASTRLRTLRSRGSRTVRISSVPHLALRRGDPVLVTASRLNLTSVPGRIETQKLSYDGAAMETVVRMVGV